MLNLVALYFIDSLYEKRFDAASPAATASAVTSTIAASVTGAARGGIGKSIWGAILLVYD